MNLELASVKSPVPVVKLTVAKQTSHANAKSSANVHLEHVNANFLVYEDFVASLKLNFVVIYLIWCICFYSITIKNVNINIHITCLNINNLFKICEEDGLG